MKALELFLRLLDKLITSFQNKKAQSERNKLEQNPADWFNDHFNGGVSKTSTDKTDKTSN